MCPWEDHVPSSCLLLEITWNRLTTAYASSEHDFQTTLSPPSSMEIMDSLSSSFFKYSLKNIGMDPYFLLASQNRTLFISLWTPDPRSFLPTPGDVISLPASKGESQRLLQRRPSMQSNMKGWLTHWSLWQRTVSHTGLVVTLKQLRYQLGRSQPPPVCCREAGWLEVGVVMGANVVLAWMPRCDPRGEPCSPAGLPDFQEPAFGSAFGTESSLALNHSPQTRSSEGKLKPVLWRGSIQTDVQTLDDQCHLLKRRGCSRLSSGGTYKHPECQALFLDPSL